MLEEREHLEDEPTVILRTTDPDGTVAQVAVAPGLGGACTELVLGGTSWLHRNTRMSLEQRRRAGGLEPARERYVRYADIGLGDVCVGTVGGDVLRVGGEDSVEIQDHGLAWSARGVVAEAVAGALVTRWQLDVPPLRAALDRETMIEDAHTLRHRFRLTGRGAIPFPAFWSTHDMFELTDDTCYAIEPGTPMVVFHSEGEIALRTDLRHRWPHFTTLSGDTVDLSRPGAIGERFAAKIFSAEPAGPVALERGGRRLTLESAGTHIALWTNNRGWAPEGVAPGAYRNLCMERSSAPTDRVSEARQLRELRAGESEAFEVVYRAGPSLRGRGDVA